MSQMPPWPADELLPSGGPAVQRWLNKVQMKAQEKIQEEQRKQQERQGTTQPESLFEQALMANNLTIVID